MVFEEKGECFIWPWPRYTLFPSLRLSRGEGESCTVSRVAFLVLLFCFAFHFAPSPLRCSGVFLISGRLAAATAWPTRLLFSSGRWSDSVCASSGQSARRTSLAFSTIRSPLG